MSEDNKKEKSYEEIKSSLREELKDLYDRYGFDMDKIFVSEDDLRESMKNHRI